MRGASGYLYDRLLDLFHQYVVVGGMPDAVNSFLATRNVDEVRNIHRDLHALYRDDIAKYAPPELRLVIRDIYDLIPSEAGSKTSDSNCHRLTVSNVFRR